MTGRARKKGKEREKVQQTRVVTRQQAVQKRRQEIGLSFDILAETKEEVASDTEEEEEHPQPDVRPKGGVLSRLFEEPIVTDMEGRVKALEESLQAALAEVTRLTTVTDTQQDRIKGLTGELAKVTPPPPPLKSEAAGGAVAGPPGPVFAGGEKVALPQKFDGSTNLMSYLVQFNVMAAEQGWGEAKKGIVLLGRLKGRALDVAAQGEDHTYAALVERLKRHFVPDNEDMYAQ